MEMFLILVVLTVPGQPHLHRDLHQEWTYASSFSACQITADKRADEHREKERDVIQAMKARVNGRCYSKGTSA